jgi:hypothetical protein
MSMSKQEATDFVIGELAKRRDRNDIIQEVCHKTGGTSEQVQRFVQWVESQNRPPAVAPTSPPAPSARQAPSPAGVRPVRQTATGSAQAEIQPPARQVESSRPTTTAPAVTLAAAPKPAASTFASLSPAAIADTGDVLNTPENTAFVIKEIAGHRHRNDIILALCEKTGSSWDSVQRFVQKVESENRQAITARQSPLLIMIGVGTIVLGLLMVAYYGFRTLTGTIYIFLNMPIPYLGNAVYIGTGLAMMAGGTVGVLRTARNLIQK